VINHCDRHFTLLSDTDIVQSDSVINHCDRRYTLLSDTDIVVRHSVINHCDRHFTSITKKSEMSITVIYHTMSDCTISVSLRRVKRLSQ
jgi:hypothetical protein